MQTISARIKDAIAKELSIVAKETERTMSFHVEKALKLYLNEFADLQVALDHLNDPTERIISLEEMEEKIALRDKF